MNKLIIDNRSDLPMEICLKNVIEVVKSGRISNGGEQYCYLSVFTYYGEEYHIASDLNKKSDKLTIYKSLNNTP